MPETAGGGGLRPMQLMIKSLGGCAAVDVIVILKKQRQSVTGLRIDIEAERFHQPLPAPGKKRTWLYLSGKVDLSKAEKAVAMSLEKYCSAAETLRLAGATPHWETRVAD
ncbi:MAG: OsmC family protein [Saprospirales bacterium]|nr:OsmC family protein [Saprospirales bacterium]